MVMTVASEFGGTIYSPFPLHVYLHRSPFFVPEPGDLNLITER